MKIASTFRMKNSLFGAMVTHNKNITSLRNSYDYTHKAKKKKLIDSQTLFSKIRCMWAAFYFYFYFLFGYILGHLGLSDLTKW